MSAVRERGSAPPSLQRVDKSLELKFDRPELGLCKGDLVMFDSGRMGLDGDGLYAIRYGAEDSPAWMVDRLKPLTRRGTPRRMFSVTGLRFEPEDVGRYIHVYRVIATYRHEPGIGRWESGAS